MVLGTILQAASYEKIQMIISRIVSGIGNGINTCAVRDPEGMDVAVRANGIIRCRCGKLNASSQTIVV